MSTDSPTSCDIWQFVVSSQFHANMKFHLIFLICITARILSALTNKAAQRNDTLVDYFNCLIDKEECPPGGDQLKADILAVLEDRCVDCNEQITDAIIEVLIYLSREKPKLWKELKRKFEEESEYEFELLGDESTD